MVSLASSVRRRWRIARPGRAPGPVFALLAFTVASCGGRHQAAQPEPAYAESRSAQDAFRLIQAHWVDSPTALRPKLEPELRRFLAGHGDDGRSRIVRSYLGWLVLGRRRTAEAHALVAPVLRGPPGAAADFARVVEASAFRREGDVKQALRLLLPLRGRIADPDQRGLYSEELVRALVESRRFDDAMAAMLDWADQASPSEREDVVATVEALIRSMPTRALESGLHTLVADDARDAAESRTTRSEARRWLIVAVRERLVRVALTDRDPELARRLIDATPTRLGHDEVREALSDLAATSSVAPRVDGRAVGVVLEVGDDVSKRRSADVVAGMTRALGLPASAEHPDAVRLLTRDAAEPGDVEHALSGLAGDGAAILVCGVTDETAVSASLFAERRRIPVVVLRQPPAASPTAAFTFVLGADPMAEATAISRGLERDGARSPLRVGPGGVPCESADPTSPHRFPVASWKHDAVDALAFTGDADCARDAAAEALAAGMKPILLLGLEAAEALDTLPGQWSAVTAGRFPFAAHALDVGERAWVDRWGSAPSWFDTLGRDAAMLSAAVLSELPRDRVQEERAVEELHRRAKDGLGRVRVPLWSTAASGFAGKNVISRELTVVKVPGRTP